MALDILGFPPYILCYGIQSIVRVMHKIGMKRRNPSTRDHKRRSCTLKIVQLIFLSYDSALRQDGRQLP